MTTPSFQTTEVAQFYDSIKQWSHPEHPFLDANYCPGSFAPAVDMTPFVTDCLIGGKHDAIRELWSFLTWRNAASDHLLEKALSADMPAWLCLSTTAKHELKAMNMLLLRAASTSLRDDVSILGAALAATAIGSRQLAVDAGWIEHLLDAARMETRRDSPLGSTYGVREGARVALEAAMSPLGDAEPCAARIKSVSPMARMVVADYVHRDWGKGLRYGLYYDNRMYGCGEKDNQAHVEWLDFFAPPEDDAEPPSTVTKDALRAGLEQHGVVCRKTSTRKELVSLARTVPGLLKSIVAQTDPSCRVLRPDWAPAVKAWAERTRIVAPVGAAVLKMIAASAL